MTLCMTSVRAWVKPRSTRNTEISRGCSEPTIVVTKCCAPEDQIPEARNGGACLTARAGPEPTLAETDWTVVPAVYMRQRFWGVSACGSSYLDEWLSRR